MEYRPDSDLDFFSNCSAADLDPLIAILTQDRNGNRRWTEQLTGQGPFKRHSLITHYPGIQ